MVGLKCTSPKNEIVLPNKPKPLKFCFYIYLKIELKKQIKYIIFSRRCYNCPQYKIVHNLYIINPNGMNQIFLCRYKCKLECELEGCFFNDRYSLKNDSIFEAFFVSIVIEKVIHQSCFKNNLQETNLKNLYFKFFILLPKFNHFEHIVAPIEIKIIFP